MWWDWDVVLWVAVAIPVAFLCAGLVTGSREGDLGQTADGER